MIAGGRRDVVFAATEHDSVYAFDVHGTRDTPLWKAAFIDPQKDVRTLTEQDVLCPFITAGGGDYSDAGDRPGERAEQRPGPRGDDGAVRDSDGGGWDGCLWGREGGWMCMGCRGGRVARLWIAGWRYLNTDRQ